MSGTSLDGVDAILGEFTAPTPHLIGKYHLPFPAALKHQLWQLQTPLSDELHLSQLAANQLAHCYAQAVDRLLANTGYKAKDITAIGCHGQTIRHRPECGYTIQLGNAALLAELTNINVISDFRSRDIAAQGQGAPLVPAFHAALFSHTTISRAIINIGGISNLTYLPAQQQLVKGFDCGPGNVLMDFWIAQHLEQAYDHNGQWAAQGQCIPELLTDFLTEPFFQLAPPKSTGRDLFNPDWLNLYLPPYQDQLAEDIQATLLALTAHSIVTAIHPYPDIEEVYLCGGGAYNKTLYTLLEKQLPQHRVATTTALGVAPEEVEPLAFAWLAYQTLHQRPGNLPAVTGAQGLRILGNTTFA
jgi:anhydro-N-acetylmuramic acid kinase